MKMYIKVKKVKAALLKGTEFSETDLKVIMNALIYYRDTHPVMINGKSLENDLVNRTINRAHRALTYSNTLLTRETYNCEW